MAISRKRFIVRADEKLVAFFELEGAMRAAQPLAVSPPCQNDSA